MFNLLRYFALSFCCFIGFNTMTHATVYTSESELSQGLSAKISNFWQTGKFDTFQGVNDIRINYAGFVSPSETNHEKCLVIVSGRSEGYLKYEYWLNDRIDQNDHYKHIYRECVIASPNWISKKQDLIQYKIFENLNYPEDYSMTFL